MSEFTHLVRGMVPQLYADSSRLKHMSFEEGMRLFRSGDVPGACEQFQQVVEQDENNHKAWNALGICLSKTGEYEDAETCFENALMLDPGNATYEKNRDKNDQKRPVGWKVREKEKPAQAPKQTQKYENTGYQRNWLQIPIYIIPMILSAYNLGLGILAVIVCAYYIKRDADSINAGMNPDASLWGKMKGWEWMLLLILFWILLPLYSWKREKIYNENLEFVTNQNNQTSNLPTSLLKICGGIFVFFFICIIVAAFVFGFTGGTSSKQVATQSQAAIITYSPIQQVTSTPSPTVEQTQNRVTLGEKNAVNKALSYLKFAPFSREGLIKQLEYEGFSHAEAVYGTDQSGANWDEQAAGKAEKYLEFTSFSRDRLIEQLKFEGFTPSQAEYGVKSVGY